MFANTYEGVLEKWKVRLIGRRARRMGFRGCDLDDVQQQVALALLDFQFDQSSGASEKTAVTAVIDRQLAMIRRGEGREKQRLEVAKERCEESYDMTETVLSLDVDGAVRSLPPLDQQICRGLSLGSSISQLAATLGISWHTARAHVEAIRRHFEQLGLPESFIADKETART